MQPFPPLDQECFVDTNIFHAHAENLGDVSAYASRFMLEITKGERRASTYVGTIADAVHKMMLSEAAMAFSRPRAKLLSWIQNHQESIKKLTLFRQAADEFANIPVRLLPTGPSTISLAAGLAQQHGLLTNDAIAVALMRENNILHLVTNDDDFDRVPGITVWKPR